MNRIIAVILASLLALAGFSAPAAAAERHLSVTDFDRVRVDGAFQVSLATGLPSSAIVSGSQQAIDRVSIEVQGRTLRVSVNRSAWGGYPGTSPGPVRIQLTTRDLRAATVAGAGNLVIDKAKGLRIDLSVAGTGRIGLTNVDADLLTVGLLGSGRISLAGKVKNLRASIQGTGDLDAAALRAEDADIQAGTDGGIAVAAVRTAKIRATGLGEVVVTGRPACTVEGPAAGQVVCGR